MKMTVIGCGHLGATHAACMASIGHEVCGVDIDEGKVALLNSGRGWFHEPYLDLVLAENIEAGRLRFTTEFTQAADFGSVHFIAVATPEHEDGSYNLMQLHAAVSSLVPHLRGDHLIIGKSTVPPGTAANLQSMIDALVTTGLAHVEVAWNPEFLREGRAVQDTLHPDRIVVGTVSTAATETVREIYLPLTDVGVPLLCTDLPTSELAKGAANAFLATKISFINAMADICAAVHGDISALAHSLGLDPRIGNAFLCAGVGYGGACLPKDVRGLGAFARAIGAPNAATLLSAVDAVNASRSGQVVELIREAVGTLQGKQVAVWGAAFKVGTDDVRNSVGLWVADKLRALGASVTVYDPMAGSNALVAFPELHYADSAIAAAASADVIVVVTAWPEFAEADPAEVAAAADGKAVVDACQAISITKWRDAGWQVSSLTGVPAGQSSDDSAHTAALVVMLFLGSPILDQMGSRRARVTVVAAACLALVVAGLVVTALRPRPYVFSTTVTVNTSGKTVGGITSHYVGLSFESGSLSSGKFANVGDLAQMLRNLGGGVLRFGGNSADRRAFTGVSVGVLSGLAGLAEASGWTVLYTENLATFATNNAGAVAADARKVSMALGSNLAAIACGNEPDDFRDAGMRPATYTEDNYLGESASCLAAVRAGAPGVPLAGPDTAGTKWLGNYAAKETGTVDWLDQHYYALGCTADGALSQVAAKLLSPAQTAREVTMFNAVAAVAEKAHAHVRISETNTACGGGIRGLSDAYASALWVIDYMLTGAEHGVDGMNFHGGLDGSCQRYTPLCEVGPNEYAAQPIYYGMLFTHLLGSGQLLPVTVATTDRAADVAAFALVPVGGAGVRLIVENLSQYATSAALRVGGDPASATVINLTGPSLLATSGVQIQGAAISADGKFTPGTPDTVSCSSGSCPVSVAPYSAALVSVGTSSSG